MQKNGQPQVSRKVRLERAIELRLAGATYGAIATALGVTRGYAFKLVDAAVKESAERCGEAADKVRTIELARLDKMRLVLWPKRADPRVAQVLLQISERTAKLHGLDKPVKIEASGPDGGPLQVQTGQNLSKLTLEELKELERLEEKMRGTDEPKNADRSGDMPQEPV